MQKETRSKTTISIEKPSGTPHQHRRILRTKEAAQKLGLQPSTLEKWRVTGDGPPYIRLSARAIGYLDDVLDQWIIQRSQLNTAGV